MTAVDAAVPVSHAPIQNGIVVFGLIAVTLGAVLWISSPSSGSRKHFHGFVPTCAT